MYCLPLVSCGGVKHHYGVCTNVKHDVCRPHEHQPMAFISAKERRHKPSKRSFSRYAIDEELWRLDAAIAISELDPEPTPDQGRVIWEILNWYFKGNQSFGLLAAPAGTGKTFTAGAVLSVLAGVLGRGRLLKSAILAAPTHRALRVARNKLAIHGLEKFTSHTCARLTGMKVSTCHKTGREFFTPKGGNAIESTTQLLVIDEASMINKEMHDIIRELVESEEVRCLLIGDASQLPPIKERMNPFFSAKTVKRFELTEVVRHGGPILEAATKTRMMGKGRPVFETVGDGAEIFVTYDRPKFHKMIREAFSSVDHAAPDHVQALCWTNNRVKELNRHARSQMYGRECPLIVTGELLISTNPIFDGGASNQDDFLCPTSTYVKVQELSLGTFDTEDFLEPLVEDPRCDFPQLKTYEVTGWCPDMEDTIHFTVIHEESREEFDQLLREMKTWILQQPESQRRDYWRDNYYPFRNWDAPVQSACAMTTHRAQGTTLDTVFIDLHDMDRGKSLDEGEFLNRIVYTALTRAAKRVVMFDPKSPRN